MKRDFHLFWAGQATSAFGSVFTTVALPLVAVRRLGATPAQMGLLVAAGSLPLLLFGLLIAAWVDRLPRRRPWLVAADVAAAAGVGWLAISLATGHAGLLSLGVTAFALGALGVVVESAYFAHLRSLVPDGRIGPARARLQASERAGGVLARVLAGPAVVVGAAVPFALDATSYVVSAVSLVLIRTPEPRRTDPPDGGFGVRELLAGFAALAQERFLRRLVPYLAGQQFVTGITLALLAPFLVRVLGVPTAAYGLLFVLVGVAAVAGSALAGRWLERLEPRRLSALANAGVAASTALLPFAGGALPLAMTLAALGIALPSFFGAVADVGLTAFVTVAVDERRLGRAAIALQLVGTGALVAGSLAGGLAGQWLGVRPALWLAAGLSVATLVLLRPLLAAGRAAAAPVAA